VPGDAEHAVEEPGRRFGVARVARRAAGLHQRLEVSGLAGHLRDKRFPRTDLLSSDPDLAAVRRLPGYPALFTALEKNRRALGPVEDAE
jgi:hypothetical protein